MFSLAALGPISILLSEARSTGPHAKSQSVPEGTKQAGRRGAVDVTRLLAMAVLARLESNSTEFAGNIMVCNVIQRCRRPTQRFGPAGSRWESKWRMLVSTSHGEALSVERRPDCQ
ncbi:hypothetical protein C8Q80DRAFT_211132 [Daedaleopsis nitida]|nr:hypothetical protein C8Q80DRAFT_211132 [Daedaleopsis nitida]